jgi:hypothetical protein
LSILGNLIEQGLAQKRLHLLDAGLCVLRSMSLITRLGNQLVAAVATPVFTPIKVPFEPSSDRQERGRLVHSRDYHFSFGRSSRVDDSVSCSTQTSRTHPRSEQSAESNGLERTERCSITGLNAAYAPRGQTRRSIGNKPPAAEVSL